MAQYVDGFLLAVPKNKMEDYRRIAETAGKVWREHGALEYRECVMEDADVKFGIPFPKQINAGADETVVFSWIVYASRAERDRINELVMKDPRLCEGMDPNNMPFDCKRMVYGGFDVLVQA